MPTRLRDYFRPADLSAAVQLLRGHPGGAVPLWLGPRPPVDVYQDQAAVVELADLGLAQVTAEAGQLSLGAALPLQTLVEHPAVQGVANGVLSEAARLSAHLGLRQAATLGGALLAQAGPPEIRLALLALDAVVLTLGAEPRATPLAAWEPAGGELPLAVTLGTGLRQGGALERVARMPLDEAIVAAVAVLTAADGVCQAGRVAVASAGPHALCWTAAELGLTGQPWTPARGRAAADTVMTGAQPAGDYRGSADYRRAMAGVLAGRALAAAWRRAQA